MSSILSRLDMLRGMRREDMPIIREQIGDSVRDARGVAANMYLLGVRFLAVADFIVDRDVQAFRAGMSEACALRMGLIDRYDSGEGVAGSYVSMLAFRELLCGLAGQDFDRSHELARKMGGRPEIEKLEDDRFQSSLGYSLKYLIIDEPELLENSLSDLFDACAVGYAKEFLGYAKAIEAIRDKSSESFSSALQEILKGHRAQCRLGRLFDHTVDEVVAVWALGMLNLGRYLGLSPDVSDDLLPLELFN